MEEYKGTRKITRRELNVDVNLKVHESSKGDVKPLGDNIKAKARDISETGMGIYSSLYIPDGAYLEIELGSGSLGPGGKKPIHLIGRVTSCVMGEDGYRIGIQFTEMSDQDKAVIKNYIEG